MLAYLEASDKQSAKICPACQRIMLRYKVGHGLDFALDQCGHCNGVWFDKNEWEAMKQRNLHDEVHTVFSAHWQSQLRQEEVRKTLESVYEQRFQGDYDQLKQLKTWLDAHPEKQQMMVYLNNPDPYSV